MATVREGNKGALLIVDVQEGVMKQTWDAARVIANVARAVERAREARVPVIWVQHADDQLQSGSAAWQWVSALKPANDEVSIQKQYPSSFEQTGLEASLANMGVSHITLAGAQTNWCIRATAYAALERGYDITLVKDAHTTDTLELEDGAKIDAATLVRDLNVAMKWLSYAGRTNRAVAAEDVDFSEMR